MKSRCQNILHWLFGLYLAASTPVGAQTQSWLDDLHLSFGFSGSYLSVLTVNDVRLDYGGVAFNTAVSYRWPSFSLGFKSIADIGIEKLNDNLAISTRGVSLDRGIQYVSFTPFYQYFFRGLTFGESTPYVRLGTASSLTSLAFNEIPVEGGKAVRTKTTIRGRGVNLSIGLSFYDNQGTKNSFIEFDYQNVAPGVQQLINIEDFSEVATIRKRRTDDFERVHVVSISWGKNLF